jgi:hypothetical protein
MLIDAFDAGCRYAGCRYAECRGAVFVSKAAGTND